MKSHRNSYNKSEQDSTRVLPLKKGVIYGPVHSRRLGSSLGINLMPSNHKVCSFNCVYCHYGWTDIHTINSKAYSKVFPGIDLISKEIENALKAFAETRFPLNYITFSGNGEPTLHPDFKDIVEITKRIRNKYLPDVPLAILSNSTTIGQENIRHALENIDVRIMKLDTGDPLLFAKINYPVESITLQDIIEGLKKLDKIIIQSIFMKGIVENISEKAVDLWIKCIAEVRPLEVQIYTVDRPPAHSKIVKVERTVLKAIAQKTEQKTSVKVNIF